MGAGDPHPKWVAFKNCVISHIAQNIHQMMARMLNMLIIEGVSVRQTYPFLKVLRRNSTATRVNNYKR
ncbi:conserved hypothetical protein [Alteromonas sp. 38]|nr:conserved hypothetical protein [Alteromonas sp. 154]VXC10654.1 conserved hypothetical protein [Alteromonas sp. 38]